MGEFRLVERCQHGDGKQANSIGGGNRGFEHRGPSRGMNGQQVDVEVVCGPYGTGDRVGNVVELEVEKDPLAAATERADDARAGTGEELQPDLVEVDVVAESVDDFERIALRRAIERDDEISHGSVQSSESVPRVRATRSAARGFANEAVPI